MIRVVLDTNIIVSAFLNEDGLPFAILKLSLSGVVKMYVSDSILAEYQELLTRKSYPMDRRRAKLLFQKIKSVAEVVRPASGLDVTSDPDDNMFLECAQGAKAHFVVTGNIAHFPTAWKYTQVITARTFINIWKDMSPGQEPRR